MKNKRNSKRFVLSTFALGSELNFELYQIILDYCQINKAELIILTTDGITRNHISTSGIQANHLLNAFNSEFNLCNGMKIYQPRIKPHQNLIVKATAYQSKGQESLIVPSHRHDYLSMPTEDNDTSMSILGTGSLSTLNDTYGRSSTALKASALHSPGFIVVEIEDTRDKHPIIYTRQVQYHQESMSVCDLDRRYSIKVDKSGVPVAMNNEGDLRVISRAISPSKVILSPGDLHFPNHDKDVFIGIQNLCGMFKGPIKEIVIQDGMDQSYSYSHHQHLIGRAQQFEKGESRMVDERREALKMFKKLEPLASRLVHISSNHDDVIERSVTNHSHIKNNDYLNYFESQLMSILKFKGIPVYESFMQDLEHWHNLFDQYKKNYKSKKRTNLFLDTTPELKNSVFITPGDPYYIQDCLVVHGDRGSSGSRGLPKNLPSLGKLLSAHTHSPFWSGTHVCVGTSSKLNMGYNKGIGAWQQSLCIVHLQPNGEVTRQLIHFSQKTKKWSLEV